MPDPVVIPHHVLVRPLYSLISSGTETASIHQEGVLRAVADNPSQLTKDLERSQSPGTGQHLRRSQGKVQRIRRARLLGCRHRRGQTSHRCRPCRLAIGWPMVAKEPDTEKRSWWVRTWSCACRKTSPSSTRALPPWAALRSIAFGLRNLGLGETVAVLGLGLGRTTYRPTGQASRSQLSLAIDLKEQRVELARSSRRRIMPCSVARP